MLLVLHVGYSLWTSPLLIHRLAVRRGSLKARGVLLWGGDPLGAGCVQRVGCRPCAAWCPGSSGGAWAVSRAVLIPRHRQGGGGPLKLPDLFFSLFECLEKGKSNLPAFQGLCCSALSFLPTPLTQRSPASPLLPLRRVLVEKAARATLGRREGSGEAFRAADNKSEVSGKTKGLDLL